MASGHRYGAGHPYYPPKDPAVVVKAKRRKLASLAMVIREAWPPEEIFRWLRAVAAGQDPDRPPVKDGGFDPGAAPIDWPIRMRAAKMLLERALGQPAQHIHLEAALKAEVTTAAVSVSASDLKNVDDQALEQLRGALRALAKPGQTSSSPSNARPVIDVGAPTLPHVGGSSSGGDGDGGYGSSRDEDEPADGVDDTDDD